MDTDANTTKQVPAPKVIPTLADSNETGLDQISGSKHKGFSPVGHRVHAVVDAIAHIHIKSPRLTKERFVAR